jgi:hypothetical protein
MLMTAVALVTIVASPAFAQKAPPPSSNAVIIDGQVVGQDPDINVRLELRKSALHGMD